MSDEQRQSGGDFRDVLYTIDKDGRRKWVYPAIQRGHFYSFRLGVAWLLICFYLSLPWITINGKQGVLLDLVQRKFTFFGTTFWATDTIFLLLIFGGLGLSLFLFTSLFGRVWCGWACPETVFLEFLFRPIERLIEGNSAQRKRLDAAPWTFEKIRKKFLKHSLCALLAWVIASTFLAYFVGSDVLIRMMSDWPQNNIVPFSILLVIMGAFAFQFGWFREQFCTVLCPYARFQSVLMDADSLVVGYDRVRGEPRGKLRKNSPGEDAKGDCVDCKLCVRACPTGIDIRNGLQLECISCTQCIDACDSIMEKVGRPSGLIRYDTENRLTGNTTKIIRPRVIVYLALIVIYLFLFSYALTTRIPTDFQLLRGPDDAPYTVPGNGGISNHLHARVSNKSDFKKSFTFRMVDSPGITLITPIVPYELKAGEIGTTPIFLNFPSSLLEGGKHRVSVEIEDNNGFRIVEEVTLLGPDN